MASTALQLGDTTPGDGSAPRDGAAASALAPREDAILILHHDAELIADLDRRTAEALRRRIAVPRSVVEPGPWIPPQAAGRLEGSLGLVVTAGFLVRSMRVGERDSPEIFGPGDLIQPWDETAGDGSVDRAASWRAVTRTTVALLDHRFTAAACRWPSIMSRLVSRSTERSRSLALTLAIIHARHTETRLLMLMWHLADRWGTVTPAGVHVPLPLTHAMLADLVCVRRPTVSTAAARLSDAGRLVRATDGTWLLHGEPPTDDEGDGLS